MFTRVLAPIPTAVALLLVAAPSIGSVGATAVNKQVSSQPQAVAAAPPPPCRRSC